jgi:diguanylate cyclase (GGDEF)-like protein
MRQSLSGSSCSSGYSVELAFRELTELNELMAGSLRINDVFRSVSSRVCQLVGCSGTSLWLLDESRTDLRTAANWKIDAASEPKESLQLNEGLPARCFSAKRILVCDEPMTDEEDTSFGSEISRYSSAAIPLHRGAEVIGVLQLFFSDEAGVVKSMVPLLSAIGAQVSPVVVRSMIFERNQAISLTDVITDLPNERAFHLIIEKNIAESRRHPQGQPFSILAIDVKGFSGINDSAEHFTGDEVLRQVGRIARENLRGMDFFARSHTDEFLAVLPTATEEIAIQIIARIENGIAESTLRPGGSEFRADRLNIGWAVFGQDGEAAASLLSRARSRKNFSKELPGTRKVILFPKRSTG